MEGEKTGHGDQHIDLHQRPAQREKRRALTSIALSMSCCASWSPAATATCHVSCLHAQRTQRALERATQGRTLNMRRLTSGNSSGTSFEASSHRAERDDESTERGHLRDDFDAGLEDRDENRRDERDDGKELEHVGVDGVGQDPLSPYARSVPNIANRAKAWDDVYLDVRDDRGQSAQVDHRHLVAAQPM